MRSLSPRLLRDLESLVTYVARDKLSPMAGEAFRLMHQLEALSAPKRSVKLAHKRVAAKKATRKEQWEAVKAEVLKRAGGRCEQCLAGPDRPLSCDHFFGGNGRRKSLESVRTVWALCVACDFAKTANSPSAAMWLERFIAHCIRHGYVREMNLAKARLDSLELQGRAG